MNPDWLWMLLMTAAGFFSGAVPYSVLLGRLAGRGDIRAYGDHNPGGTNVLRAAGRGWGVAALLLDGFKGAIPVGIAWFGMGSMPGMQDWRILPVALAPVLGHAFSPFLGGRGGKAVAVTFGIWTGLTLGVSPIVLGPLLGVMNWAFASAGWAVIFTMVAFGGFVLRYYAPAHPIFAWVWLGNLAVLVWKHRGDLAQRPRLRIAGKAGGPGRNGEAAP